ncbi:ABC transporter permease [Sporanaerobacter sp. PP17-6a]|uniref:ABC transporter permease n=1 Tax=Sporanaerobacter sp. PP17-6a TaxID=1891289 RepID=UPI00089FECC3|nr:ABC transporter permease [Sporanaerobacter sp. PP17-6a]SCL86387.1 ABC-type transport system involved in multi-copper enzyme maturation, permease component [Sporanaerobacter sp. PP17-6a]
MELFLLEHKKLWRKKSVKICVLLCFLYIVVFGSVLSYQWFNFGSSNDYTSSFGNNFDGYSNIRSKQTYADQWRHPLTDETLQQMVRDYQKRSKPDQENNETTDWKTLNTWIDTLWPELEKTDNPHLMIDYVDPDKLTDFYKRRQQAVDGFLELNGQTGEEKNYFLNMDSKTPAPFNYDWVEGWSTVVANSVSDIGMVMALFIAIALSPMFSGEWHNNTKSLIATTRNGWQQTALAKIGTGVSFTLELFTLIAVGTIGAQLLFLGTRGWNMPIQFIKLWATAPMNMLQAEIYEYAYVLLASLGFTGITLLLSTLLKSNFSSLLASLAVVYVPMAIAQFIPLWAQKLLDLLPFVGSSTDIFRTNAYHLFGKIVWSPYLLIIVPVCIGLLCIPITINRWSQRMKV